MNGLWGARKHEEIDAMLDVAKRRISLAALACLRGSHDAAVQVRNALDEVEAARQALRALHASTMTEQDDA